MKTNLKNYGFLVFIVTKRQASTHSHLRNSNAQPRTRVQLVEKVSSP